MKMSRELTIRQLGQSLFIASVVAVIVMTSASGEDSSEPQQIAVSRLLGLEPGDGRPANFYELVFTRDEAVCSTILADLNTARFSSEPDEMETTTEMDRLLGGTHEVDWASLPLMGSRGGVSQEKLLTFTPDHDGDSQQRHLLLTKFDPGGVVRVNIFLIDNDQLGSMGNPVQGFTDWAIFSKVWPRKLDMEEFFVGLGLDPSQFARSVEPLRFEPPRLGTIYGVAGALFVLAAPSVHQKSPPYVFVFPVGQTEVEQTPLCVLASTYTFKNLE